MSKPLFNQFDPVSSKAWKQKIQLDLKGADYNETLIWRSLEGIDVKPFYHSEDINEENSIATALPTNWSISQDIYVTDEKLANTKANNAVKKGAETIRFVVPNEDVDIQILLKNLKVQVIIAPEFIAANFVKNLNQYAIDFNDPLSVETDIIGNLTKSGNWFTNLDNDHQELERIVEHSTNLESVLSVNVSLYQNAGATIIQQLAYAIAHANEYLNHFDEKIIKPIVFNVSVGSNYFFEIAKIRALRALWQLLSSELLAKEIDCIINVVPTRRNKTIYDYNTNLLRTTTECMSAILGGANLVTNSAYDGIYHKDNEFGERIARNQLLVLKNESYFNQVSNPTAGAYYIEELTSQLANKALKLFKDIEANGGFLSQLKQGTIQRKIKESAEKEQEQFDNEKIVLLGTNKYQNENDSMKGELELYPFVKINPRKTLIEPIIEKRLAEKIEKSRLKKEN